MTDTMDCPICLSEPENPVRLCADCQEPLCCSCLRNYLESKVNSAYMGTCPVIHCPSSTHHKSKKRRVIAFTKWKETMPAEITTKYSALANSLLAFLCGGCHSLKSLDVGFEISKNANCYVQLTRVLTNGAGECKFAELESAVETYCLGLSNVEEFYEEIGKNYLTNLSSLADQEAWELFSDVLRIIPDPERRANLHLRYLRDRPRMKTLCCSREHCFRCKIKDFHERKSCMENMETLDHSVVNCPACGIALAKGDGCNTITCVCGKQFSWSSEKENMERCHLFLQAHPDNTSQMCAHVLCSRCSATESQHARAWQNRYRLEVSRSLRDWFKVTYWPCPSQCSVVLPVDTLPEGVREAADIWKQEHSNEVERCKKQNEIALKSIFTSLVPDVKNRPVSAHRFLMDARKSNNSSNNVPPLDVKLVQSVQKWIEDNQKDYLDGLEAAEEQSAMQFLFLYGDKAVGSVKPAYVNSACSYEWCRLVSNNELTYTNDDTSVERVGSVSCYPAAFSMLMHERAMIRVQIDTAPKSSNWLTFGIARKGMASSSSDGVGRTSNSWGLSDDRSSSTSYTIVAASGAEVASFRKLRVGDILSALIDTSEGWCEISINENEFTHRFEKLPTGTREDYYFAMTFANDHRVSIIFDPSPAFRKDDKVETLAGELNPEHTIMYCNFKKQCKKILMDSDDLTLHKAEQRALRPTSNLIKSEVEWLSLCGSDEKVALEHYQHLKPGIERVLSMQKDANSSDEALDLVQGVTFNVLLQAISWYRANRDSIREMQRIESAMNFSAIHGDDAPFIAAITLADYHAHKVGREEQSAALAYMQLFNDEMQAWYEYDTSSKEPVIENVAKQCRCLPRHMKNCPMLRK